MILLSAIFAIFAIFTTIAFMLLMMTIEYKWAIFSFSVFCYSRLYGKTQDTTRSFGNSVPALARFHIKHTNTNITNWTKCTFTLFLFWFLFFLDFFFALPFVLLVFIRVKCVGRARRVITVDVFRKSEYVHVILRAAETFFLLPYLPLSLSRTRFICFLFCFYFLDIFRF